MGGYWAYLPYPALYQIFQHLTYKELISAGQVCKVWYEASLDDLLWKELFLKNFIVDRSIPVVAGKIYKHLQYFLGGIKIFMFINSQMN